MRKRTLVAALAAGAAGAGALLATGRGRRARFGTRHWSTRAKIGVGASVGSLLGAAVEALTQVPARIAQMEQLMPKTQVAFSYPHVSKPVPTEVFTPKGSGTDFETRPSAWDGFITSNDRFYIRSHSPTPDIDMAGWRLKIDGSGVNTPVELTYEELEAMPQVTLTRTMECAGNGRRFYKEHFGVEGEGGQWRMGAMGCAE